ncbi:DET1- and DDB1-associated protein 1 isoform X1 [Macrobrachium rosenbergii]|uniref:DET1- and DDB1-associated protein 1 isoform X1 n=1 Tax=Macrobrachium rosenbergii TaxID=79674 RepID=UPI0034D6C9E2
MRWASLPKALRRLRGKLASSFLKGLPVYNEKNFSRFQGDPNGRSSFKKPPVYLPVKDNPDSQEIVTEKTNILLRYLHQQWEKKCPKKKRETGAGNNEEEAPRNKRPRLEPGPSTDSP